MKEELKQKLIELQLKRYFSTTAYEKLFTKVLETNNLNLDEPYFGHDCSLLWFAIEAWDEEASKLLIENGLDVNHQNDVGETALHYAASANNEKFIKFLIKNGANVNIHTNIWGEYRGGNTALHYAAREGFINVVKALLQYGNIDIDLQNAAGSTALHLAVERGQDDVVVYLIDKGANQLIEDVDGDTAYDIACSKYASCVRNGASSRILSRREFIYHQLTDPNILKKQLKNY